MKCLKLHKIGLMSLCLSAPLLGYADPFLDQTTTTDAQSVQTTPASQTPPPASGSQNTAAFQHLLNSYFPLTPDQIHQFKNATAVQQEANAAPPGNSPPEGTSQIIPVTLKPGGIMPVIRVGRGMITSMVITDAAGQVWPIISYSIGDPSAFAVQWTKSSGVLMIQGQKFL